MPSRDEIAVQAERLRAALGRLTCSRSDALALLVLAVGAAAAFGLLWTAAGRSGPVSTSGNMESAVALGEVEQVTSDDAQVASDDAPDVEPVVVYVSGHVSRPGVYDLPAAARVADALAAAGGARSGAALDGVNLARRVTDGEQIHVPAPGEAVPTPTDPGGTDSDAWLPDGRLDINRASTSDFEELPGVGPVTAERIVAHRDEVGRFESIGDLLEVRGIGERTLAALADLLAV